MNFFYLKVENRNQYEPQLKESLKNFGLRPTDWVIKAKSDNTYRIENSDTPEFYFEGVTKQHFGKQVWKKIYLRGF
jgi:hypothetical protein